MAVAANLKRVLEENLQRAIDGKPPIEPTILTTMVANFEITERNEVNVMFSAMRIKAAFEESYRKARGIFSRPVINVACFKEADSIVKDTWRVIVREMESIG